MWTARARWKVDSGALDSAVVLVQGSHADWEDVGREESTTNQNSLILAQPDIPAPCEITIDFPDASFFVSLIRLSSTARACEVYSRKLGSQDHEYVCTARSKEQLPPLNPAALSTPPESSPKQHPPDLPASTSPPEANAQSPSESQDRGSNRANPSPDTTPQVAPPPKTSLEAPVPFYTCGIKLARGPALTSLRLKFVSLRIKAELQIRPITIYASRGPASVSPPRLTGNSLSVLAPLLPALGPLLSSGVLGLPQLPGAFSHLLPSDQGTARPEAQSLGTRIEGAPGAEDSESNLVREGVNKLAASSEQSRPVMPEGLAQLMASMQGLRTGGAHSHPVTGAHPHSAGDARGSAQRPAFDLAGLMAAASRNSAGVSPGGVTPAGSSTESGAVSGANAQTVNEPSERPETMEGSEKDVEEQATFEAILTRLEGLEDTCLRIERAVTGALSGFDARLRRLEDAGSMSETHATGIQGSGETRSEGRALNGVGSRESFPVAEARDGDRAGLQSRLNAVEERVAGGPTAVGLHEGAEIAEEGGGAKVNEEKVEVTDSDYSKVEPVGDVQDSGVGGRNETDGEFLRKEVDSSGEERPGQLLPLGSGGDALERVSYEEAEAAAVL